MVSGEGVIPVSHLVWTCVKIRVSFSYAFNIGMVIMRINFRSPIHVITFFFYKREVIELHATENNAILQFFAAIKALGNVSSFPNYPVRIIFWFRHWGFLLSFFYSTEFSEFAYNQQLMLIAKVPSVLTLDSYQHFSALYLKTFR